MPLKLLPMHQQLMVGFVCLCVCVFVCLCVCVFMFWCLCVFYYFYHLLKKLVLLIQGFRRLSLEIVLLLKFLICLVLGILSLSIRFFGSIDFVVE